SQCGRLRGSRCYDALGCARASRVVLWDAQWHGSRSWRGIGARSGDFARDDRSRATHVGARLDNLVLDGGHATGALAGATPTLLIRAWHVHSEAAHQTTFVMCAVATMLSIVPYLDSRNRSEETGNFVLQAQAAGSAYSGRRHPARSVV